MTAKTDDRGKIVVAAGVGINLALGVLYTWSIFKDAIKQSIESGGAFNWDLASLNDPYAICCLVFAFTMILAGKVQDQFGPRITAIIGGILVGLGFIWISQSTAYLSWVLGFGVLTGAGIAFGYSAATPPAMKWFPPNKTGKVAGMAKASLGTNAFLAVALLAVGNASGRVAAGIMSDKIGRSRTLTIVFLCQAALMFMAMPLTGSGSSNALLLVLLTTMIGFNYGANLAIFPTFTKDLWGIDHFGVNYGLIFTACGIGGFVMSKASQNLLTSSGTFSSSLATAGGLLISGAVLTFFIKDYKAEQRRKHRG